MSRGECTLKIVIDRYGDGERDDYRFIVDNNNKMDISVPTGERIPTTVLDFMLARVRYYLLTPEQRVSEHD